MPLGSPNEQLQRLVALRCDARRLRFHILLRSRRAAMLAGLRTLIQTLYGPERPVLSIRFETMPSTPSRHAWANAVSRSSTMCWLSTTAKWPCWDFPLGHQATAKRSGTSFVAHRTTDPTLVDSGAVIPSVLGLDRPLTHVEAREFEYLPAHLVLIDGKKTRQSRASE
jgi:hypothetical protein